MIKDCADKWALTLNRSKTALTLFSLSSQKETVRLQLDGEKIEILDTPTFLRVTLDPRPTWKPHLEIVENKSIRRLYHMKKLAGTKWGASLKIPRQVYTGNVRPVAEYASSWSTSSKANKTRIDKVLNMGLRIIHGAIKSTAVWQMEKMVNIQPFETRGNFKIQCQAEKAKIPLPHPLHQKLNQPIESRLQRKLLNHKVKELKRKKTALQLPHRTIVSSSLAAYTEV